MPENNKNEKNNNLSQTSQTPTPSEATISSLNSQSTTAEKNHLVELDFVLIDDKDEEVNTKPTPGATQKNSSTMFKPNTPTSDGTQAASLSINSSCTIS